ncbi:phosphonate metabolism protein/1,5-bisphosphokinase (PRPP-forming) PhnN [Cupriavidus pinatubonensis]|uniref:Ribose 1,5-bisphosphate phosphokinase PhnN n=1 Tax=Cupriavidus pinatubonensis TaxID=248026 RepID=A0ABM8X8K1_9BURK|nr:phosphonate metabolism protein/1,5-bisphosphokinase (PRPP-forming) PhnN [Cupriavidus pinatubonensis]CAG9176300.1 Ribose 1,5-bisphosphate phosphokinase PhnN [Cupriavidus pinatubonensis]
MNRTANINGTGLFYVMGPSGSGKDSLLRLLHDRLGPDDRVVVAHRYITRDADANEASVPLSAGEFARRAELGCLALHWRSHGLHYGIGVEIEQWMARGLKVIVNGSREYLPHAVARYPALCAVHVRVKPEVLAARLRQRGRESEDAIARRLARATEAFVVPAQCRLVEIDNSGALADSAEAFARLVGVAPASA